MEDCHQLAVLLPPSLDSFGGQSDPVLHRLGVARVIALEGGLSKRLQLVICKMEGKWGLGQGHELRGELAVCEGSPSCVECFYLSVDIKIESYSTPHAEGSILKIKWVGGVMEKKAGSGGLMEQKSGQWGSMEQRNGEYAI